MTTSADISRASRERCFTAASLRYDGLSFREIGQKMGGITVETARQTVLKGQRLLSHRFKALNWCACHVHLMTDA